MKLIKRDPFMELPPGTLFSIHDSDSDIFDGPYIKGDTIKDGDVSIDFFYEEFINEIDANDTNEMLGKIDAAENTGCELKTCKALTRDGTFADDAYYAIYSRKEIIDMTANIVACLHFAYTINEEK